MQKPYRRFTASNVITLASLCAAGLFASAWWAQRQQAQAASAPAVAEIVQPVFREMATPHGTLLEMRVPVDPLQVGVTSVQICYVWRDALSDSASLSCPGESWPQVGDQ